MGFLDRLESIGRGVVDISMAPLGVPYDLIRMIPDKNMNMGRAFGGNFEQLVQGLGSVAYGTGASDVVGSIAEHTALDEILGEILFQSELIYNQSMQLEYDQAPLGGFGMDVDPGTVSIARVLGMAGATVGSLTPVAFSQAGAWGTLDNISKSYSRTDPRIMGLSPGQSLVLNETGAINLPEEEMRTFMGGGGFKATTLFIDVLARWYTQPEVIAGKSFKVARRRWDPDTLRYIGIGKKKGWQVGPADDIPVPKSGDVPAGPHQDLGDRLVTIKKAFDSGDPGEVTNSALDEILDLADDFARVGKRRDRKLVNKLTEDVRAYQRRWRDLDLDADMGPDAAQMQLLDEATNKLKKDLNDLMDQVVDENLIGRAAVATEEGAEKGVGGALNMQVRNPTGRKMYHVTTESQFRNMTESGVLRVPPGADDMFTHSVRLQTFVKRLRQELPDLIDEDDAMMVLDRVSPTEEARLTRAFMDVIERVEETSPTYGEIDAGMVPKVAGSIDEQRRILDLLDPNNIDDFIDGSNLEDILNLASNPIERRSLAIVIYQTNTRVASNGIVGMNTAIGFTDNLRIPAKHNRAIYLLDEDELPEAYRYAAALYADNPMDRPVIIELEPDGLPVIFDDFTNPQMPDPRSGLPSDASMITRVDQIKPEYIKSVHRPAISEIDAGELSVVLREGRDIPKYLEPGGRMHERLFNPDGSPVRPEDMMKYEDIVDQFMGMTEAYNTGGPEVAIDFANAAIESRRVAAGNMNLASVISKSKRFQMAVNWMDGKSTDEILRMFRVYREMPGGPQIADMLSHAGSYEMRRQICLAVAGIFDPETTMLPHMTRARIRALRNQVSDMEVSPEYARAKRDLKLGMVDELDQANMAEYQRLSDFVDQEVAQLEHIGTTATRIKAAREAGGMVDRIPRYHRGVILREHIRQSYWYQESILSRPIRSVIEKRPRRWMSLEDPQADVQIVRQLEEARPLGVKASTVSDYRNRYIAAANEIERERVVLQMDREIIRTGARHAGLEEDDILQLISSHDRGKATTQDILKSRRYAPDSNDMVKWFDPSTGQVEEVAMPLFGTQLQNWAPLTDVRKVIQVSSQIRRYTSRFNKVPKELLDSFNNIWKPSVLIRGGWPIRVVSDEQLRVLSLTGSLIAHLASISAGETPPWGFINIFGPGRSLPQRAASTLGLPVTMLVSGSVRAVKGTMYGARKLKLLNAEYWDDLTSVGTEGLASSRASFSGPSQSILQEGEALWGVYETGIMDHLVTGGTGEWSSVAKGHHQYYPAWKRALQDQIGRDPLGRIFLESGGSKEIRVVRYNPNYTSMRGGLDDVLRSYGGDDIYAGIGDLDPHTVDQMADELFEVYEAMSRGQHGRLIELDVMELENEIHQIITRYLDVLDVDGLPRYDEWTMSQDIASKIHSWRDMVIDEAAEFGQIRAGGTLHNAYIAERLSGWFDDVIGPNWMSDDNMVDIYNSITNRWLHASLNDSDEVIDTMRRSFVDAISKDPAFGDVWAVQSEMLPGMADDFRGMYSDSWMLAKGVEVPTGETARHAARKWLMETPEGAEYRSRLPWRADIEKWLDGADETVRSYTCDYNPRLTAAALDGKVDREVLGSIDEALRPPTIHAEIIEQSLRGSSVLNKVSEFTATAFDTFGRLPTDTLSRQPFFKQRYADEMRRLRSVLRGQGIEPTEAVIQRMSAQSRAFALREVKTFLYDLSETSRFGHMMRWFIPFYPAWQEVIEVWSGLVAKDPSIIGRAMLIWRAPNKMGMVEKDDEGNEFIILRLSEGVVEGMGLEGWMKYIAEGGVRFGKSSFNMVTNSPIPSAGPVIQLPINEVVKNRPDLEEALRFILPYGVKTNSWEVLTSPLVKRAGALISGPEGSSTYQRDLFNAIMWLDWRFRTGESTMPPSLEEANEIARKIFALRLFANLTSPAQPIFDSPLKPYMDIYREMIETYGPEEADEMFLGQYGEEFFAVTLSRSVSKTGIPPTIEGQAARQKYENLISRYPEYGRFIIGEDASIGEFSSAAFAWQMSNPPTEDLKFFGESDREYRDFELDPDTGMITEVDRRLGWQNYIQMMDLIDLQRRKRGLPNLRVKDAEDLNLLKQALTKQLAKKYPEWWRDFNARDDLKWPERIKAMRSISSSILRLEERPDMQGVQDYLEARSAVLQELNHRRQLGGSGTLSAQSNKDLAGLWDAIVFKILDDNIHFLPVYYRYLEGDTVELNSNE